MFYTLKRAEMQINLYQILLIYAWLFWHTVVVLVWNKCQSNYFCLDFKCLSISFKVNKFLFKNFFIPRNFDKKFLLFNVKFALHKSFTTIMLFTLYMISKYVVFKSYFMQKLPHLRQLLHTYIKSSNSHQTRYTTYFPGE